MAHHRARDCAAQETRPTLGGPTCGRWYSSSRRSRAPMLSRSLSPTGPQSCRLDLADRSFPLLRRRPWGHRSDGRYYHESDGYEAFSIGSCCGRLGFWRGKNSTPCLWRLSLPAGGVGGGGDGPPPARWARPYPLLDGAAPLPRLRGEVTPERSRITQHARRKYGQSDRKPSSWPSALAKLEEQMAVKGSTK